MKPTGLGEPERLFLNSVSGVVFHYSSLPSAHGRRSDRTALLYRIDFCHYGTRTLGARGEASL